MAPHKLQGANEQGNTLMPLSAGGKWPGADQVETSFMTFIMKSIEQWSAQQKQLVPAGSRSGIDSNSKLLDDLPRLVTTDKRGDGVTIRLALASDLAAVPCDYMHTQKSSCYGLYNTFGKILSGFYCTIRAYSPLMMKRNAGEQVESHIADHR